jgi:Uma2 family endonuclease
VETARRALAEEKVILHGVSWETYASLLADHLDRSSPRFAYDRGELEISSPSTEHEEPNRLIAQIVEVVAEEIGLDIRNLGSMTFKREDLERGFEPDSCFYVQNEERIRGKRRVEAGVDPPPDLIVEIDVTSPSLYRFPIYAAFGVPEIWRYDGHRLAISTLATGKYVEVPNSVALCPC